MEKINELKGQPLLDQVNASQYDSHSSNGFYESYFLRANHPTKPYAFWIRYTVFNPENEQGAAQGQLWGVYFDGSSLKNIAIKQNIPISECSFSNVDLSVRLGSSTLNSHKLKGSVSDPKHKLLWDLKYEGDSSPSFLLPHFLYNCAFPKAKALTGLPFANFSGHLHVDDKMIDVTEWQGSQNHNWGTKHTDMYAWGQVSGFDNNQEAFLECSTAKLKIGPLWTPWFTNLVIRLGEKEIKLNSFIQSLRNKGRYENTTWLITARNYRYDISVLIEAHEAQFVKLLYDDPTGKKKTCLNSKIASCKVIISERGKTSFTLHTKSRAAFEILT